MRVDVVLVSPLLRTLQTATRIFGTKVPMVAVEAVREAYGLHPCDRRSPVSAVSFVCTDRSCGEPARYECESHLVPHPLRHLADEDIVSTRRL